MSEMTSSLKFTLLFFGTFAFVVANPNTWKLSDSVEITENGYQNEINPRSESNLEDNIETFVKSHDASFTIPFFGSKVHLSTKNLDNEELNLKIKLSDSSEIQARKKSKIKKVFIPLLVFLLLKIMTIVPLAIGILAMKAWNGLQLSFFSFIVSLSLAIFEMCKKLSYDYTHPQVISNEPWKQYAARNFNEEQGAEEIAYSAYLQ